MMKNLQFANFPALCSLLCLSNIAMLLNSQLTTVFAQELAPLPISLAGQHGGLPGRSPMLGRVQIGAYAPEAALNYGIDNPCLMTFDDRKTYATYREAVRNTYGADLSDMNYLGIGVPGWQARYAWFRDWLFRSAPYGDPTIALEPIGPDGFGVFQDSPEMRCLRQAFVDAGQSGITVWVRFASESNDAYNHYSIRGSSEKIAQYRAAVHWFRSYMPSNVKIVFSPLLNDFFMRDSEQKPTLAAMYEPGVYDRIGGTLYATTQVRIEPTFNWYYNHMSQIDPNTRFQICELGGTFANQSEITRFVLKLKAGQWPKVDRVNLFAGQLNPTAVKNHGDFGLVLPGATTSYLRPIIAAGNERVSTITTGRDAGETEQITLIGRSISNQPSSKALILLVTAVVGSDGRLTSISPPRRKLVYLQTGATITSSLKPVSEQQLKSMKNASLRVSGPDHGRGTPLLANAVRVLKN